MNQRTTARVITALAVAVVSGGCAMKGDIRTLQEEIRSVAARQDSLITMLAIETQQTQDTLRTQTNQMFDFRGDIARRLQQIEQSLARLEAIAGENQRGMAAVRDQLANLRRGGVTTTPQTGGTTSGLPRDETLVSGGGGNADQLWGAAGQQRDRGSLNSAARAYEQFIAEHPDDARAPDAYWYLGDLRSQQDRPEDALRAFLQIQQLFPTSPRVPEALYRAALLHEEMGDLDEARAVLERIMNTYPDALVSSLAREKLREIG
ncbi:MAG: tetratricopeptide repeat protein [Longimicrobiales bacterium]|nr:tetratricopeptide repeat protein [Longimicrobiales bacterium]